jgi:hypothetical protein
LDEVGQSVIPVGRNMAAVVVDVDTVYVLLYGFRYFLGLAIVPLTLRPFW